MIVMNKMMELNHCQIELMDKELMEMIKMKKKMFYLELENMIYVGMLRKSYQILNKYQIEDHKFDPKKTK